MWLPESKGPKVTYTPALEMFFAQEGCNISWETFFQRMTPRQRAEIVAVYRLKNKISLVQSVKRG